MEIKEAYLGQKVKKPKSTLRRYLSKGNGSTKDKDSQISAHSSNSKSVSIKDGLIRLEL